MATRTKNQNTYVHGDWNVSCDRCGFKFKSSDVREEWNGLMVCEDCWESRHPADMYKYTPSKEQYIPYSRPEASTALQYLTAADGSYVQDGDGGFILLGS